MPDPEAPERTQYAVTCPRCEIQFPFGQRHFCPDVDFEMAKQMKARAEAAEAELDALSRWACGDPDITWSPGARVSDAIIRHLDTIKHDQRRAAQADAEVKRLRAALEQVIGAGETWRVCEIAREALGETG